KGEHARLLIDAFKVDANKLARGQLCLQHSIRVEQIVVTPAVAFRPVNHLAGSEQPQRIDLDVGVGALLNQRLDFAARRIGDADVDSLQVAAGAIEVESIRRIAEPLWFDLASLWRALLLLLL